MRGRSFLGLPSQRGTALSHTTLPSLRMHEMVCEPWVLTNPSSHRKEMELPSWRFSPKRFPFTGTPGSGHSLWRKAAVKREKRVEGRLSTVAQQSEKDEKQKWVTSDAREVEVCKNYYWRQLVSDKGILRSSDLEWAAPNLINTSWKSPRPQQLRKASKNVY